MTEPTTEQKLIHLERAATLIHQGAACLAAARQNMLAMLTASLAEKTHRIVQHHRARAALENNNRG